MIEQTLSELIPSENGILFEAARYSLEGGKRLRPRLTLAVVETFGEPLENALHPACALEMVHTYSLIHDDLPCMDNDDIRRNKPTLHKAYPESHAVLTGDFLLTYAFEVLANAPHLTCDVKNALIAILAKQSGSAGMIGGQILDMEGSDSLVEMHTKKTGALITAALEFGAVICGMHLTPFQKIGEHLGLAFQVVDDLLDNDGIVAVLGVEKARQMVDNLFEKASVLIQSLPGGALKLQQLAEEMLFRTV